MKKFILKKLYPRLPSFIKKSLIRRMAKLSYCISNDITFKVAESKAELEGSFKILHDAYVEQGFMEKSESGIRVTKHHLIPSTSTLAALVKNEVVGTVSLVRDNILGLPLESKFNLSKLRKKEYRLAEITCLAIGKKYRRENNKNIFFPLLKFMYEYCTYFYGVDAIAIVIHPKDKEFYEALMFFEMIEENIVEDYYGAPAIAMYLDLNLALNKFKIFYSNKKDHYNLYKFFVETKFPNIIYPIRIINKINDPVMNYELIKYFFIEKTKTFSQLNQFELLALKSYYLNTDAVEIFPTGELPAIYERIYKNVELNLKAYLFISKETRPIEIVIKDCRDSVLKISSNVNFEFKHATLITFTTQTDISILNIEFDYKKDSIGIFCNITNSDEKWKVFMEQSSEANRNKILLAL